MEILKCKACGGELEFTVNSDVCTCIYCGSIQTRSNITDAQKVRLFNRGNRFRIRAEYDEAIKTFENIIVMDDTDAEAHWCLALSRHGIEYVDSANGKVPTCNRIGYETILEDVDYQDALQYSTPEQRKVYVEEAKRISKTQLSVMQKSKKVEPFDIFICFKDKDEHGERTEDSVIGQELYEHLNKAGYKVFFSRVTLEDKPGIEFEPYIFAALQSSKIMIVVGTQKNYVESPWVRNEWSRFLTLAKKDPEKLIVPYIKGNKQDVLPNELAALQYYNHTKVGVLQDLLHVIRKQTNSGIKENESVVKGPIIVQQATGNNIQALLDRGNMALEDGEWDKAEEFFEEVLNQDARCAEAYLGKALSEMKCHNSKDYLSHMVIIGKETTTIYIENEAEKNHIDQIVKKYSIPNYLDEDKIRDMYSYDLGVPSMVSIRQTNMQRQVTAFNQNRNISRALQFATGETKQALGAVRSELIRRMDNLVTEAQKQESHLCAKKKIEYEAFIKATDKKIARLYQNAYEVREQDYKNAQEAYNTAKSWSEFISARELFRGKIAGYKDSDKMASRCDVAAQAAENKQRLKKAAAIALVVLIILVAVAITYFVRTVVIPNRNYNDAKALMDASQYEEAIEVFIELDDYRDSVDLQKECEYNWALTLLDANKTEEAISHFATLGDYKDSESRVAHYYKEKFSSVVVGDTICFGSYNQDDYESDGNEAIEWIVLSKESDRLLLLSKYVLDRQKYNTSDSWVTWETSHLRHWLNNDFLNTAFTQSEQALISVTTVTPDRNPDCETSIGNDTSDKVFLLSLSEAKTYFNSDSDRKCSPTEYAVAQEVTDMVDDTCWWSLRTSINAPYGTVYVKSDGSFYTFAFSDDFTPIPGIRPALWFDLS